ncbi:hypothetical protein F3J20_01970 [Paraburkholderia sp. Cy-641]|uniref:hypothetical protein n=1 Tax=Paraburkholderia sp. Cy-641 TaxID=2608337 RepID=UPI0014206B47|nr:hypothetical protein [Paraburkholderia sp. Cy-641]NIF76170.1 hypothetical protein [Paraburkholderia sp. Cy-641]
MNPRRVHSLFLKRYPEVDYVKCEWIHLFRDGVLDRDLLRKMLSTIDAEVLLIHVHRKLGDFLPMEEAQAFISENIGKSYARVADRNFTNVVIIAPNGVAATWPRCLTRSQIALLPEENSE